MLTRPFRIVPTLLIGVHLAASTAGAGDLALSGFSTLGAAIGDHAISFQRYLDEDGTMLRDSLLAVQVDGKINDNWAWTSQVVLAASIDEDNSAAPQLKWTLLSYRPNDEWLLRLGRLGFGGLLNQQNMDVGVSYDMARLPIEVYLLSSAYDFDGVSLMRTWPVADYEVTLDLTFGRQERHFRSYKNGSQTAEYYQADVTAGGLVLTVTDYDRAMYRIGWHLSYIDPEFENGILTGYNYQPLGDGRYTLGTPDYESSTRINTFFLGARLPVGDFVLAGEGVAVITEDFEAAPPAYGGYLMLSRKIDHWVPYLAYAQIWSDGLNTWRKVSQASAVPQWGISQEMIDDAASAMAVYDQRSVMLGTSYALSPREKIKLEAMLTRVGERSAMFDGDIADENVMTYSLSYNLSF